MIEPWYSWREDTLILRLHLQPGAKKNEVHGLFNNRLRIKIKAPPVAGKANKEIIAMLADEFKTRKSHINITSGRLNRNKTIGIMSPVRLPEWFTMYIESDKR